MIIGCINNYSLTLGKSLGLIVLIILFLGQMFIFLSGFILGIKWAFTILIRGDEKAKEKI